MPSESLQRLHFFEKIAPYYDFLIDLLTFGMYGRFLRKAVEVLVPEPGERVLDLCSGTGRVASWIAKRVGDNGKVVGMDIAKNMVEVAEKRYRNIKNLTFLKQDVTKPWADHPQFNGIFISFSLHEIPEKDWKGVLGRSYLALKEGGRMVIADFTPRISGRRRIVLQIFFRIFESANLSFLSFEQKEVLREAGFKEIQTCPVLGGLFQISLYRKRDSFTPSRRG